jgi:MinD-like ATPase involved in chromosome partitioning or flagellar assembly
VSGREGEPDVVGSGQETANQSDFAWMTPATEPANGAESEDFGPRPVTALDEDAHTESTPHPPEVAVPAYTEPQSQQSRPYIEAQPSGPQPRPYVEQVPSGPQQAGPYVDSVPSGPQPQAFVDPVAPSPHASYAEPTPSGAQPFLDPSLAGPMAHPQPFDPSLAGPHSPRYADPAASGGYTEQTPSGQQQQSYPPMGYQQAFPAQHPRQRTHADELSSAKLIKQTKRPPQSGWRKAVFVATGHLVNVGESPADVRRRELITRVNQPLRGCYKIAMLSLKGGVGKTTTTTTLGSTFASLRGDRVIAVDANPDRGTLSQKIPLETTATVRHLLRDAERIHRYSDIRAYTSQGPSRLEVLASDQDPAVSEAYSEDDYRRTVALLEHFYNIVLTDCGTGLMHSAMKGVLDIADALVIVSSGSVDGARSASATLDWLDVHGYRDLVARSVAVINSVRPRAGSVDLDKLGQHFGARCRAVCRIPFDPHLEEGAEIELDRLGPPTRLALLELAATVADGFPSEFYYMR